MGKQPSAKRLLEKAERQRQSVHKAGPGGSKNKNRDDKQRSISSFLVRQPNTETPDDSQQPSDSQPSTPRTSPSPSTQPSPSPRPQPKKKARRYPYREDLVAKWKKDYQRLRIEENDEGQFVMRCADCTGLSTVSTNPFGQGGSTNFQHSAVEGHDVSAEHARCQRQRANAAYKPGTFIPAVKRQILTAEKEVLNLLRTAYFLGKEELPILK